MAGTRTSKAVTVTMTPTVALLALPRYESSLFLLRWFQFFHEREKKILCQLGLLKDPEQTEQRRQKAVGMESVLWLILLDL